MPTMPMDNIVDRRALAHLLQLLLSRHVVLDWGRARACSPLRQVERRVRSLADLGSYSTI